MAKVAVDPYVQELIDLKPINSKLKAHCDLYTINSVNGMDFVYMVQDTFPIDRFAILHNDTDETLFPRLNDLLIQPTKLTAFNKFLLKTKTTASIRSANESDEYYHDQIPNDIQSLHYETPDKDDASIDLFRISNLMDITNRYRLLFKDKDLSKSVFDVVFDPNQEWISVGENGLNNLQAIGTTEAESESGNPMYIARTLFGNSKSIIDISFVTIDADADSEIVLFRQTEEDCYIFHLIRFVILNG